jgi:hypothetical protein
VQTDVWARFQRLRGHRCLYVCASDAHGTPTMLRAEQEGTRPEALVERVTAEHKRDFATYRISVDNYLTTHSPENEELTTELYRRLAARGFIARKTIKQAYDEKRQMFPWIAMSATCPNCGAGPVRLVRKQWRDLPLELKDDLDCLARSLRARVYTCSEAQHSRTSCLSRARTKRWRASLDEWSGGTRDWDISRDPPYFGFRIPGEGDKYFYVWFDAPIGYMASFLNLCRRENIDFDEFWGADSKHELYHFIGKDIPYFHALFWPAMLSGAGYRKPSGLFAWARDRRTKDLAPRQLHHGRGLREEDRSGLLALLLHVEAWALDRRPRFEPRRLRRQGQRGSRRQAGEHRESLRGLHPQAGRRKLGRRAAGAQALRRVRGRRRRPRRRLRAARDAGRPQIMALADRANQHRREEAVDHGEEPSAAADAAAVCTMGSTCSAR